MNIAVIVFGVLVLLFSAVLHEVAHGYMAERLGDDTARRAGRLTLNPLVHLDPFTSVLMPLLLLWLTNGSFFFAAAKPVPYDPRNLKDPRSGGALIALAGPATNFLLALVFGIVMRIGIVIGLSDTFMSLVALIVYINIILGSDSAPRRIEGTLRGIAANPDDISHHVFSPNLGIFHRDHFRNLRFPISLSVDPILIHAVYGPKFRDVEVIHRMYT